MCRQDAKAQEYFGIIDDQHSAEAAALDLPDSLCKVKGDLLLIEMAVNEVSRRAASYICRFPRVFASCLAYLPVPSRIC